MAFKLFLTNKIICRYQLTIQGIDRTKVQNVNIDVINVILNVAPGNIKAIGFPWLCTQLLRFHKI